MCVCFSSFCDVGKRKCTFNLLFANSCKLARNRYFVQLYLFCITLFLFFPQLLICWICHFYLLTKFGWWFGWLGGGSVLFWFGDFIIASCETNLLKYSAVYISSHKLSAACVCILLVNETVLNVPIARAPAKSVKLYRYDIVFSYLIVSILYCYLCV